MHKEELIALTAQIQWITMDAPSANMFDGSFRSLDSPDSDFSNNLINFELSDILEIDNWPVQEDATFVPQYSNYAANQVVNTDRTRSYHEEPSNNNGGSSSSSRERKEVKDKVAFRTLSQIEILDDGYKWRKYGKKMVKNSPNSRNYYRCSVEGCPVKKRVERDKEDSRYVITTYEGVHNHQGPSRCDSCNRD